MLFLAFKPLFSTCLSRKSKTWNYWWEEWTWLGTNTQKLSVICHVQVSVPQVTLTVYCNAEHWWNTTQAFACYDTIKRGGNTYGKHDTRSIDINCYLTDLSMLPILPTRHQVQENHAHLQGMWQNQWITTKTWVWLTWQAWSWRTLVWFNFAGPNKMPPSCLPLASCPQLVSLTPLFICCLLTFFSSPWFE